jgi:ferric-dicitrate binding protein FerR (iron transport regulator)
MTRWSCLQTAALLQGRAAGLSEGDRLRLEEHLEGCATCRADAAALDALTALARGAERIALSDRAVSRAIASALRGGDEATRRPAPAPGSRRVWVLASVGAVAVAAAMLFWTWRPGADHGIPPRTGSAGIDTPGQDPGAATAAPTPSSPAHAAPAPAAVARVARGRVTHAGGVLEAGAALPADVRLDAAADAELEVAHARVTVPAGAAVSWSAGAGDPGVTLHAGHVIAAVDPAPHAPFHVRTADFRVEVVGTRFEVRPHSVRVHEGVVRVRAPGGAVLVEALGPGGSWQLDGAQTASAPAPAAAGAPAPDAGKLLAGARRALADGQVAEARKLLARVDAAKPTRAERAEADTLGAEAALVAGDPASAAQQFARVARRYHDLPAGESALYAEANAWSRAGRGKEARAAARRYLERYPDGRFVDEARGIAGE